MDNQPQPHPQEQLNRQQRRYLEQHPEIEAKKQKEQEEKAKMDAMFEEEIAVTFKRKELAVIFNILTRLQIQYGDFKAIDPIVQKIHPHVAVAASGPGQPAQTPTLNLGKQEEGV